MRGPSDSASGLSSLKSRTADSAEWTTPTGNPPTGKSPVKTIQLGHRTSTDSGSDPDASANIAPELRHLINSAGLTEADLIVRTGKLKVSVEAFLRQTVLEKLADRSLFDPAHHDMGPVLELEAEQHVW